MSNKKWDFDDGFESFIELSFYKPDDKKEFFNLLLKKGTPENTVRQYVNLLAKMGKAELKAEMSFSDMPTWMLEEILYANASSPFTFRNNKMILKKYLQYKNYPWIDEFTNIAYQDVSALSAIKEKYFADYDELYKYLTFSDDIIRLFADEAIFILLYYLGLDEDEIINIQFNDIDTANNKITISKNGQRVACKFPQNLISLCVDSYNARTKYSNDRINELDNMYIIKYRDTNLNYDNDQIKWGVCVRACKKLSFDNVFRFCKQIPKKNFSRGDIKKSALYDKIRMYELNNGSLKLLKAKELERVLETEFDCKTSAPRTVYNAYSLWKDAFAKTFTVKK